MGEKRPEKTIFEDACNGYGFEEIPQVIGGVFCQGCLVVHKRPTKMYSNKNWTLCRFQVVNMFDPEKP